MSAQDDQYGASVYHIYTVTVPDAHDFQNYLSNDWGIDSVNYYSTLPHESDAMKELCRVPEPIENAKHIGTHGVSLPLQPYLTGNEVTHIISAIDTYGRANAS
jgi:dTDP-4-amino-4,6-dideoxygalactose transaminase